MKSEERFTVVGYASADRKFSTGYFQGQNQTTMVCPERTTREEAGGVFYFARCLRRCGGDVGVVTWVGRDRASEQYLEALAEMSVNTSGVAQSAGRLPSSHMFYDDTGSVVSFYDPGTVDSVVSREQIDEVRLADNVLLGVAPERVICSLLAEVRPDAWVTWAVKADPIAVTPEVATLLVDRADLICLSEDEWSFVVSRSSADLLEISRRGTIVVVTRGADGALCLVDGKEVVVHPPDRIETSDPTGAGDTFAAGLTFALAESMSLDMLSIQTAVRSAAQGAADLLIERERSLHYVE